MEAVGTIVIGSDHAGFELKGKLVRYLSGRNYKVIDAGPDNYDKDDDYPDYALEVCRNVIKTRSRGVLICSTGQGMDRVANKVRGINASVAWNELSARVAKEHGDVNIICLGQKTTSPLKAKKIVDIWLNVPPSDAERHVRRRKKTARIESGSSRRFR